MAEESEHWIFLQLARAPTATGNAYGLVSGLSCGVGLLAGGAIHSHTWYMGDDTDLSIPAQSTVYWYSTF